MCDEFFPSYNFNGIFTVELEEIICNIDRNNFINDFKKIMDNHIKNINYKLFLPAFFTILYYNLESKNKIIGNKVDIYMEDIEHKFFNLLLKYNYSFESFIYLFKEILKKYYPSIYSEQVQILSPTTFSNKPTF
jgi:hypothetical protein